MTMQYIALDPRPAVRAAEIKKLQDLKNSHIIVGFEVTVPEMADLCHFNIDPQHSGGDVQQSCIKAVAEGAYAPALQMRLQSGRPFAWVTIRPDLDSVGAMAIALILNQCGEHNLEDCMDRVDPSVYERLQRIHTADCSRTDEWQPRQLYSNTPGYEHSVELGAIAKGTGDFKIPLEQRVQWVVEWLESGDEPGGYREAWEKERGEILSALESGETQIAKHGSVCIVKSHLRAATSIGYQYAPVLICWNPEFSLGGGESHLKISICQYSEGYVSMGEVLSELRTREPGWGGSATFIGSTQGESAKWSPEEVLEVVKKHLL